MTSFAPRLAARRRSTSASMRFSISKSQAACNGLRSGKPQNCLASAGLQSTLIVTFTAWGALIGRTLLRFVARALSLPHSCVPDCVKSQSTSKVPMIVAARQCRPMTHVQTLTMRLPRFSPARSPIKAAGVFSSPSITSSSTFNLPASTQSRRSAIARSRWLK
jgi:hypothetical protein